MNFYNHLISGDHKGYASLQMERQHGTSYHAADDFVVALANSDPGDVTPNTNLDNTGPVDSRRLYVDLGNFEVQDRFTGMGVQHTCPSAYGYSFAGGAFSGVSTTIQVIHSP